MSAFLLRFKADYLEKMRRYPYNNNYLFCLVHKISYSKNKLNLNKQKKTTQNSKNFVDSIALAKTYFFRAVLNCRKKPQYLVGKVLCASPHLGVNGYRRI